MVGQSAETDNDSDSVIYMSDDNSIASIIEIKRQNASIESVTILSSSSDEKEEDDTNDDTKDGDVVLQEEKFIVMETVEDIQEVIIKEYEEKATQTYHNELPADALTRTGLANKTSGTNTTNIPGFSGAMISGPNQSTPTASGSVSASIAITATTSGSIRPTNKNDRNSQNSSSKNSVREKRSVRNNVVRTRRIYNHTKSYKNHRVQPYRCYNRNYNSKYNRPNYRNYSNDHNNNYNNRNNNYGNNRYDTVRYSNYYRYNHFNNVQRYNNQFFTNQFKERLFRGFVNLMNYVFEYDYYRDVRY